MSLAMRATEPTRDFHAQVARLAAEWAVPCSPAQDAALAHFASLLMTWTARINLTGAASADDLASNHFPDSFALAARLIDAATVVDVGSGGGLPALPLALLRPELRIQLVEPIAKKVAFLRTAIRELGLGPSERAAGVQVHAGRIEAGAPEFPRDLAGGFDVAFSRATLAPDEWLPLGARLVRPGGRVFVLASSADAHQAAAAGDTRTGARADAHDPAARPLLRPTWKRSYRGHPGGPERWLLEFVRSE
jgi:16S rRNA (guanine527-N7)-methyltransferase